ncbi:hypothetical protein GGS24DRAFT_169397 [Hypoxylon argillaceum]|nr:hypothetical protein GGS24DRAFT_169397 [Hypoxylon argillaceum]KAI1152913.1 hypothetical protein F4825DRAFT_286511 [Nemania diffusa]
MFPTLARRLLARRPTVPTLRSATETRPSPPPTGVSAAVAAAISRYKPKKVWPPDFSKLSQKEQFRFERRYKRRVRLAATSPRWDRGVRLARLGSVIAIIVYVVLFMDLKSEFKPFDGIRDTFWGFFGYEQQPDLPKTADQK